MPSPDVLDRLSRRARWAGGDPIINAVMARTIEQPDLISLAAGFVDHQTLPIEATRQAFGVLWTERQAASAALQYGTTIGYTPLRQRVLDRLLRADGVTTAEMNVSLDQVVLTAGSNQLLALVSDILLDPGDIVLCAAPTYFVYLGILTSLGAVGVGVDADEHGIIPAAVEQELARCEASGELHRVKAIYVITYFANPTGTTVSAERRLALLDIAKRWSKHGKIYLLEDAAYRELRYYGEDVPSLWSFDRAGDTVVHAGTFSKTFSPGIRVGWGILPPVLRGPALAAKGHIDFGSPNFNQMLMAKVVELGLYDAHLQQLHHSYRAKVDAILGAAEEHLAPIGGVRWMRPTGGLYLWVELPEEVDASPDGPLFERAIVEGVLYLPGEFCYPTQGSGRRKNTLRLTFGIESCEHIKQGVAALSRAIRLAGARSETRTPKRSP